MRNTFKLLLGLLQIKEPIGQTEGFVKKYMVLFVITTMVFNYSCKPGKKGSDSVLQDSIIHVHLPETKNGKCFVSSIAKKIEYIPLETKKESLFNFHRFIIEMNDSLIVLCDKQRVLMFNRNNGEFIRRIGKTGKGPGEYLRVYNMILNDDTLYVTSSGLYSIIKYTLDGQFQGNIDIKKELVYFSSLPNGWFASYDQTYGNILFFDREWTVRDTVPVEYNVSKSRLRYSFVGPNNNYFFRVDDRVLFTTYTNDTIWDITNMTKNPAIIFDLKDKLLDYDKQLGIKNHEEFTENIERYHKLDLVQSDSLILAFTTTWNGSVQTLYSYNRMNGNTQYYESSKIYDDLHGGTKLSLYTIQNNKIICFMDYEDISEEYNNASTEKNKEFWGKLLGKMNEFDNPCMVIIDLK